MDERNFRGSLVAAEKKIYAVMVGLAVWLGLVWTMYYCSGETGVQATGLPLSDWIFSYIAIVAGAFLGMFTLFRLLGLIVRSKS